jgi:hypothetical protein
MRRCAARLLLAALLPAASVTTASADPELDALKREAQGLVEQLRRELDAVQAERQQLEAERRALRAGPEDQPPAEEPAAETAAETAETDRKVGVLAEEIARLKERIVLPEAKELKSAYGLGPAASKVYQIDRGLSIGGYGEANYSHKVTDTSSNFDSADFLRFVLYTGYKFTDRLLLNAELELEHATTASTVTSGNGSFAVELAYLDYLASPYFNTRAGLVLMPLGFINEIHEPLFFHGNNRPEVERAIIPTTWRELGVGIFGSITDDLAYRTYLTTSPNASGFDADAIRGGRQQANRALAEDGGWSGRLDYSPHQIPGLLVGGSAFLGSTGQDQRYAGEKVDAFLSLWDVHAQYRYRGVELRALAVFGSVDDAAELSLENGETVPDRFDGWYAEVAYDVMPHLFPDQPNQYLAPFFRYESFDTQSSVASGFVRDLSKDTELYTLGLSYKPHPQVVLKFDYRRFETEEGHRPDDVNIGLGFIF